MIVSPPTGSIPWAVDFMTFTFLILKAALLADVVKDTTSNFEWANDSQTVLYGKQHPETLRSYQVFRHRLGDAYDSLVYEEPDETNYLYLSKSLSSAYFYLVSSQTLSTEVRYLSADRPNDEPTVFLPREADHEYWYRTAPIVFMSCRMTMQRISN